MSSHEGVTAQFSIVDEVAINSLEFRFVDHYP